MTTRPAAFNDFTTMPFVTSLDGKATSLWAVAPSGDWAADNVTGRDYASAMVDYMRVSGDAELLGMVARAIGEAGQQDGIQVGVWTGLAESASLWLLTRNSYLIAF